MLDCEIVPLETLCDDIIDCPHSTPTWRNEGVLVIRNFNIVDGNLNFSNASYVDEETYAERIRRGKPESGDIIISREAPMGAVCMIPKGVQCCLGQRVVLLKVNRAICDPAYLLFVMQSQFVQAQIKAIDKTGSTVSNLNIPDLKALKIPCLEKSTQEGIGAILTSIAERINLNNALNAELEKTAKLLYDYWFVQFDFPNAEGKPYRVSGGEMVWNEQLKREIPKGWEVKTVGDCVVQITTGLNPRNNFVLGNGTNRYVTIKSIENGRLDFSKCDFVDDDALVKIHNRSDISVGDILFTSIEPVGRLYRIWEEPQGWDINESVFSIRTNTNKVSTDFLYATMDSNGFRATTTPLRTGSVQKGIRIGDLRSIKITVPSKQLQTSFSTAASPIYRKMWLLEKQNMELIALRDFLLPLLMNGQVTVADRAPKLEIVKATPKAPTKQEAVFKRMVLAAYILDNICEEPTAGRVKLEKMLYLCEHCAEIPLHSEYRRAAAGPLDQKGLRAVESQLQKSKWFALQRTEGESRAYTRLEKSKSYVPYLDTNFSIEQKNIIDLLIRHFKSIKTIQCEIVATLYAAWNDFLLEGNQPTDKMIVDEVLHNWNVSKGRIAAERWHKALLWMRENEIVPIGYGTTTKR